MVHADLPPELAQGVFASGRRYPVLLRLSTMPGDPIRDSVSLPRGFAIKLIGVEGDRLPGAHDEVTQDFVLANGPTFSAPNPKKFLGMLKMLASSTDKAEGAKEVLSKVMQPVEKALEAVGIKSPTVSTFGGYRRPTPSVTAISARSPTGTATTSSSTTWYPSRRTSACAPTRKSTRAKAPTPSASC